MKHIFVFAFFLFGSAFLFADNEQSSKKCFETSFILSAEGGESEFTLQSDLNTFMFKLKKLDGDLIQMDVRFEVESKEEELSKQLEEADTSDSMNTRRRKKHLKASSIFYFMASTCASATKFAKGTGADLVLGFFGSAFTLFGKLVEKDQKENKGLPLEELQVPLRSFCIDAADAIKGKGLSRMNCDPLSTLRMINLFEGEERARFVDKLLSSSKEAVQLIKESLFVFHYYCSSGAALVLEKMYEKVSSLLWGGGSRGEFSHFATPELEDAVWTTFQALNNTWDKDIVRSGVKSRGPSLSFIALLSSLFVAVSELENIADPEQRIERLKTILVSLVGDVLTLGLTDGSELFVIFENVLSYILPSKECINNYDQEELSKLVLSARSFVREQLDDEALVGGFVRGLFGCLNTYTQHLEQQMFVLVTERMQSILPTVE